MNKQNGVHQFASEMSYRCLLDRLALTATKVQHIIMGNNNFYNFIHY